MFSFVIKGAQSGVMSSFMPLDLISVNIPSTLSSHLLPFCCWLTVVHISFSVYTHVGKYAAHSSNFVVQIIASTDGNIRSPCAPVISCAQQCFLHILSFFLSRSERMLKFITCF
jgi:hypothetical protein